MGRQVDKWVGLKSQISLVVDKFGGEEWLTVGTIGTVTVGRGVRSS